MDPLINPAAKTGSMNPLFDSLVELIRRTSAEIPDDVHRALLASLEEEKKGTIA